MKSYKVNVSGVYYLHSGDQVDFEFKGKLVPFNKDMERVEADIRRRFAPMWIMLDDNYKRLKTMRLVFIDKIEEGPDHNFGFEGRDIRTLGMEEMQYLASAANLLAVQLFRKTDLRTMRSTCYYEYSERVLGQKIEEPPDLFNVMTADPLVVKGRQKAVKVEGSDPEKELDKIPTDGNI